MSSRVDPILIGLVAAGLALLLIAIVAQTLRPLGRLRLRRRQRRNLKRLRRDAAMLAAALLYVASLALWVVAPKPVQFYYHYLLPGTFLNS